MTLTELTAALRDVGIEDAEWEARLIFAHIGGYRNTDFIGAEPSFSAPALTDALRRRLRREPLQYILGEVGFYHETYHVTPDVLIPRPDTELLVEWAVKLLPQGARFADLCTGSGCVAVSTLAARTDTTAVAYDISEGALAIARENAARNHVDARIRFERRDLLTEPLDNTYDAILSNPPYIVREVLDTLSPELAFEPRIALDGGEDGMDFYRALLAHNASCLSPGGHILFEIGYDQADAIATLASAHCFDCDIKRDLGGLDRVAILKKKD